MTPSTHTPRTERRPELVLVPAAQWCGVCGRTLPQGTEAARLVGDTLAHVGWLDTHSGPRGH